MQCPHPKLEKWWNEYGPRYTQLNLKYKDTPMDLESDMITLEKDHLELLLISANLQATCQVLDVSIDWILEQSVTLIRQLTIGMN